jgi:hypothetical protein
MQDDTSNESGDNNPSRLRILFSRGFNISITEDFGNNEDAQKHLDCPTNKHLAKIAGLKFIVLSTKGFVLGCFGCLLFCCCL